MKWFSFLLLIGFITCYGHEPDDAHCHVGNFALPPSQQPAPLISFGQNIIGRNQTQVYLFADAFIGENKHSIDVAPQIVYGITDDFSVYLNVPLAASYKSGKHTSAGFEDLSVEFEYVIFGKTSFCSSDQITIVANVSFPTGSSHKNPQTGFGAFAYFIGTTYNHTWENWFCFTSYGAELPMSHHGTQSGNQYLYQFGVGRNITNVAGWMFAWMAEFDGTFFAHDKSHGKIDPNSGGNIIYVTPSLWASSEDWVFQMGLGYAVQQNLFGDQKRNDYLLSLRFGRTF